MKTEFSLDQLTDPKMAQSESVIRKCVHCGFCTATCPTYVLLGDELDSPRGRIYLMKNMLEEERAPTKEDVKHIDRCLSCLSCMTTCPSGVNYMQLVDHARIYIEENYRRPLLDRAYRSLLAFILPHQRRFRFAMALGWPVKHFSKYLAKIPGLKPAAAMLTMIPDKAPVSAKYKITNSTAQRGRVVLMQGCAEPVLKPEIGQATRRVLDRLGFDIVTTKGEGCCGALTHHMGREAQSMTFARKNIDAWTHAIENGGLEVILITASGCGTTVKDYGHMFRDDPDYAEPAQRISELAKDITEFLALQDLPKSENSASVHVAYHPPCSLQHGQKITHAPRVILESLGYKVSLPRDAHLCCGSAGTYNILQSDIASQLGAKKAAAIEVIKPDIIATGNIGCAVQIGNRTEIPIVHTIELIDWALGGPSPQNLT